jgi:hypothetical protein
MEPTWYTEFYKRTAYVFLSEHGLDINYQKHWNHGLEFRIFDGLRRDQMLEVCRFIWKACYRAQELEGTIADCRRVDWFQEFVLGCMLEGADYVVPGGLLQRYLEAIHYRDDAFASLTKDGVRVGDLCAHLLGTGACLSI